MWLVILEKSPQRNDFPGDYFPRQFYYKKEAKDLVNEVKHKGGVAKVEKMDKEMSNQLGRLVSVPEANLIRQEAAEEGHGDH